MSKFVGKKALTLSAGERRSVRGKRDVLADRHRERAELARHVTFRMEADAAQIMPEEWRKLLELLAGERFARIQSAYDIP